MTATKESTKFQEPNSKVLLESWFLVLSIFPGGNLPEKDEYHEARFLSSCRHGNPVRSAPPGRQTQHPLRRSGARASGARCLFAASCQEPAAQQPGCFRAAGLLSGGWQTGDKSSVQMTGRVPAWMIQATLGKGPLIVLRRSTA